MEALQKQELKDRMKAWHKMLRFYDGMQMLLHGAGCPAREANVDAGMEEEIAKAKLIWKRIDGALSEMRQLILQNQEEDHRRLRE